MFCNIPSKNTSLQTANRWPKLVGGYAVYNTINLQICICICWLFLLKSSVATREYFSPSNLCKFHTKSQELFCSYFQAILELRTSDFLLALPVAKNDKAALSVSCEGAACLMQLSRFSTNLVTINSKLKYVSSFNRRKFCRF